ncbi:MULTISPECIES: type II secretion system F family protein [unclassified Mesorhizobium]|uniref:type II secretion system F family protein n=1 Tax=unclassified Mesorhizobium TaxID=325217 RepID=UPI0003CF9340|nr:MULTISPECIES: type II secretion system F family protein [unclassified Mesorhizobium]ESY51668.1 pilus assembly protein TadB [Mesorhizobium sp. LNJC374B00]ESY58554.1 pilus assembly protein TadB [Mesorhizobium sp. LNJC372A00]ESZ54661.1 pilus assembly protein TadB [Mesorhizobium sp. L103C120A0]ESZ64005.1 pilus assembly protein TadB [Mesorhizobium sp. L103C131B0]WJI42673.1 type II secretion system F family protein [Mesorhizobium sp. C120A]
MDLMLIYALVFIGGLILFERVTGIVANQFRRSSSLNYRLKLLQGTEDSLGVFKGMVRERALDYDRRGFKPLVRLRRLFAQSGLKLDVMRLAIYAPVIAVLVWLVLSYLGVPTLPRFISVVLFLAALPLVIMIRVRGKRIRKFTTQLPGTLDVVTRSLSAGHPLPISIALVSRELPDPIGTEFGMLSDELTYGTDLNDAMLNMIERVGAEDLKLLAISMSVQRGTGGNFVEILENLANVVRERAILRAKVKALSAEGRITALIMSAFPFGLYLMISTLVPTYFDPVWESGYSNVILAVAFAVMAVGNFILYKLVNFDF